MSPCVFCEILAGRLPASRFHEDERFVGFMDIHPWRPGHVLLVPRAHAVRARDLPPGDAEALFALGVRVGEALRAAVSCDDVHLVLNDGPAASQSVPHVHLHVLPRTRGDAWRLLGRLARHPLTPFLPAASREALDRQAAAIRAALDS